MAEMTIKQSNDYIKDLMKKPKELKGRDFQAGSLLFYSYNAKDKENTYDKTPLVLILGSRGNYVLGLNFHWLPYSKRLWLVQRILQKNAGTMKRNNRIDFLYEDFIPLMKSVHFQPCIRLYIKNRISRRGVVIPPDELLNQVKLRSETFTNGKYTQQQLYQMAKRRHK